MSIVQEFAQPPRQERHPAIENLHGRMVQRATELRIASTHVEEVLRDAPDNDDLLMSVSNEFAKASFALAHLVATYGATRDIKGLG